MGFFRYFSIFWIFTTLPSVFEIMTPCHPCAFGRLHYAPPLHPRLILSPRDDNGPYSSLSLSIFVFRPKLISRFWSFFFQWCLFSHWPAVTDTKTRSVCFTAVPLGIRCSIDMNSAIGSGAVCGRSHNELIAMYRSSFFMIVPSVLPRFRCLEWSIPSLSFYFTCTVLWYVETSTSLFVGNAECNIDV